MLKIEHVDASETIEFGQLFEEIGFSSSSAPTDESGDSYVQNEWGIEVRSLDGYYPIDGFRWTKPERAIKTTFESGKELTCSPEHLVVLRENENTWIRIGDLVVGSRVATTDGYEEIVKVSSVPGLHRLCDLQVAIAHSFYANNVLSHNSHFLTMLGANALRAQIDVVHYTFELSEALIGRRYDSNLCDIDSSDIIDHKDAILERYKEQKLGKLIIKEFPTNSASVYTLRSHLERLDLKGFRPGLVIIDYADIMRSTRQYDSLRHELKLIYEELRGLAQEKRMPIWTASQSNKEGSNSEVVDLTNMSEAYGKAMVADVVIGVSRRSHEKANGHGRLYVAKNRAGRDGLLFNVQIDTARSKFEILGESGSFDDARAEDERSAKRTLRAKWEEVQRDNLLSKKEETETKSESGL